MNRREFVASAAAAPLAGAKGNWYEESRYLLHLDHHTGGADPVGAEADPERTARLLAVSKPDVIQIHAKGNPGWTTYPTKIGHTPPKLARDVLEVWSGIARRDGYRFSVYYNIGRDGEIMRRRPEWNRVKATGEPWERALCYHSGVAEGYLWPMVEEIAGRYRPDGFWFDGSCFTVSTCYCPRCRERFRRESGLAAPEKPGTPGWAAYKEMQRQIYREFVRETGARVKRALPGALTAVNWAYSIIMPEEPEAAVDYLTGDRATEIDILPVDAHWYDAQGKPFDLMTTIWVRRPGERTELKPAGQLEQELAVITANGGRYFAWDNPTRGSGLIPERQQLLGSVAAPFLRARRPWCAGTRRVADVALLNSTTDHYAATLASPVVFTRGGRRLLDPTEALARAGLDYEFVPTWRLLRGEVRCPVLIADDPADLSAAELDALVRHAEGGGRLLVTGARFNDRLGAPGTPFARVRRGRGEVFRLERPLAALEAEALGAVMEAVLPGAERRVRTDAPATVDRILRSKPGSWVLHLVNRAPGVRDTVPGGVGQHISDIPPAPACHVSIAVPARPRAVTLEPEGTKLPGWSYRNGRVEVDVPGFAIHRMLAMRTA